MGATAIGILATACTSFANVPQVLTMYRRKSAQDISLWTALILEAGISLWLVYGLLNQDLILTFANFVSLLLASTILGMKLTYDPACISNVHWIHMGRKSNATMVSMSTPDPNPPSSTNLPSSS